jgi:hypothetical protein
MTAAVQSSSSRPVSAQARVLDLAGLPLPVPRNFWGDSLCQPPSGLLTFDSREWAEMGSLLRNEDNSFLLAILAPLLHHSKES